MGRDWNGSIIALSFAFGRVSSLGLGVLGDL